MFNKFMPTKRQVNSLMNCISTTCYCRCNSEIASTWINILYSNLYEFNENQINIIRCNELLSLEILYENKELTLNDVETMLENHADERIINDDYIKLLKK